MPIRYVMLVSAVAAVSFIAGVIVSWGVIRQQHWAVALRNTFCSLWLYAGIFGIGGAIMATVGVTSEALEAKREGLILIVLGSIAVGTAGIFATIATKYQQARERRESETHGQ